METIPTDPRSFLERICSKRYIVVVMGFLGIANAYSMRSVLSVAITEMVGDIHETKVDPNGCPGPNKSANTTNVHAEFRWSETLQGHILGSFYYGYIVAHIPAGMLTQKYGGKHVFGVGIVMTAVLTILTPLAARTGPEYIIAVRVLEGIGEGPTFPAMNAIVAQWVPVNERSSLGAFVFAGNMIGTIVAQSSAGYLLKVTSGKWPLVFYSTGIVALIWYVFWIFWVYNSPNEHPTISQYESDYLERTLIGVNKNKTEIKKTPWKAILTSIPMWGLVFGQISHDWSLFMINADLPKYMKSVLKFSIAETGVWSSMPHLATWVCAITTGKLSDYLINNGKLKIITQRRLFSTIASIGPMLGAICASYAGCDKFLVVVLFTVGMATMGFFYSSMKMNVIDLTPNYAGPGMSLVNGVGALSGVISPPIIGYLIPNNTMLEWRNVFYLSGATVILTQIIYLVLMSASIQPWNDSSSSN